MTTKRTRIAWLAALAALAVPLTLSSPAAAQPVDEAGPEPAPLAVSAELFSRLEVREGYEDFGLVGRRLGEGQNVVYRARLGLELPALDIGNGLQVSALFQPQASGFWGDVSGGLADPSVGIHQAKTRIQAGQSWLDVGRFEMVYGEHLVIGNVAWHETGRAFDGLRFHGQTDSGAYLDAFATVLFEGSLVDAVNPPLAGDRYFLGLYAGVGPALDPALELDTYLLANVAPKADDGPAPQDFTATEVTIGVRAKRAVGPALLRAEMGVQFGERAGSRADVLAFQADADAMFKVADPVKVGIGGLYATGDDPDSADLEGWNQLYPTAHKFLGLMDIIGGRTNAAALIGKVRANARDGLDFGLDLNMFWRPETADGVDSFAGFEPDAWMMYKLGAGLSLRAMYATFIGNDDGAYGDVGLGHYGELQLRYAR